MGNDWYTSLVCHQNRFQAQLFDLVTVPLFESLVVALICLNMVEMMMETDDQSMQTDMKMFWFHFVVIIFFCIEFFLKIIAVRRHYFSYGLNILDFVCLLSDVLQKYFVSSTLIPVLRLARIIRVLPFFQWGSGIRMLLVGFMMSLPALLNIDLLFFLVLYTYSFVGMRTFGNVKKDWMVDDMTNFETFGNSMISMILVSTSSG
ncbi:hypothetical protein GOODEAATRI_029565 [Goodea atripinnis]|uniref:Ion transport domain-containing protein n=1 Tax=Goodea atripinnis TaxID=208336 RepID=A0ABV0PSP4_9TELE